MASHSALTEEGRTRIRNFQGRVASYLLLWAVVGVAVVVGAIFLETRFGYRPLQRLYLGQYIKASIKSVIPSKRLSKYILLVRTVDDRGPLLGCTDDEVSPLRDETGRVKFDPKLGPFFKLHEGIPHKYFYWATVWKNDALMYQWMRDYIYQGHSLIGLYWVCFLPLPLVLISGMFVSVKLDLYTNREYEEGRLLRGVRRLQHYEYAREIKESKGLGLPVLRPERRLR